MTKTGQALKVSVDVLRHANIMTGGAGVLHSLVEIIVKYHKHGERPSSLEIFQFTTSALFFWNAVISNKTAQDIIQDSQAKTINDYRATLKSNRQRKMFDKVSAETRRVEGLIRGNTDVINGINKIPNKDQFFANIRSINKDINAHKLRISMTADGNVNINSQYKYHPSDLLNLGKAGRADLFSNLKPTTSNAPNVPTKLPTTTAVATRTESKEPGTLVNIRPEEIIRIGHILVQISENGFEKIANIVQCLSQAAYANLMTISFNLLSKLLPENIAQLKVLDPKEDFIVQIVQFVFNYLKRLGEPCKDTDSWYMYVVREFFQDGMIREETVLFLKDKFLKWIDERMDECRRLHPNKKQIICDVCEGIRFA